MISSPPSLSIRGSGLAGLAACVLVVSCAPAPEEQPEPSPSLSAESSPETSVTEEKRAPSAASAPFADVSEEWGLDFVHDAGARGDFWLPEGIGSGGAFVDYDDDGDLDLYLVQGGPLKGPDDPELTNRLFRNDGGRFVDVTSGSGAEVAGYGIGCAAADYDADGDVDLFVTRLGPNVLLRNDGGQFVDVTEFAGVGHAGFGASASFLDYDRDGHLDLYVTNYVDWSSDREGACYDLSGIPDYCGPMNYEAPSVDLLYRSDGAGRFEDVTEASGIGSATGNGLGVLATDFDGDGWIDIYVANDQTPGFLWLNQTDGTFVEDAGIRGCGFNADGIAIAGMGVAAEDLDRDGYVDLVVTNIHDQAHLGLKNDAGFFSDVTHRWGFGGWGVPYTGFGLALFDQDHDGELEGFVVNGAVNRLPEPYRTGHDYAEPNQFLRRDESGRFFEDARATAGLRPHEMSRGLLRGDFDLDGDVDLCVTNNRGPAKLLRNDAPRDRTWLGLDLRPRGGARHAIGARVKVISGSNEFLREVRPHESYLGTNEATVYVGLGDASSVERVRVTWVDGSQDEFESLEVSMVWTLRQGGEAIRKEHP